MGLIEAIESSGFAAWVRESPSIFAYTSILALHAMGLALIVGLNTVIALRLLGFAPGLPLAPLRKLFPAEAAAGIPFEGLYAQSNDIDAAIDAVARERGCDVIVMATHGKGRFGGRWSSSWTQRVMARCRLPLLVVH